MANRLLFISIAFPPKKDPECIQTAKYFKYLAKDNKYCIDVLTSGKTLFMPYDAGMETYNGGYDQRVDLPIYENKYVNYLIRKIAPKLLERPDSKFTFQMQLQKALRQLKERPDIIYSRSYPISSSVMAMKIKKRLNIPWVMHLSDPWTLSPMHTYNEDRYHNRLEKECFGLADRITFTTQQAIRLYEEKYPEFVNKFLLFPNVFDFEDMMNSPDSGREKLRITYTGGMVGPRNPEFFLRVVSEMVSKNPQLQDKLAITFAGQADRQSRNILSSYSHLSCLHYPGELNLDQAKVLQNESDMLLLVDNPIKEGKNAVFLPSKLLDYLLARKRVIAISTPGGATHSALKGLNHDFISHGDASALENAINEALTRFENDDLCYFKNVELPKTYEAEFNANRLMDLFDQLCKK